MAFRDYQKHCTECKYGEPCGKYHLYLMKLNPTIKRKKRFKEANPDYVEGQPLYYVGKTKHHPRCRQSMHQTYNKTGHPKWQCYCQVSPGSNDFEGFWQNPSFFVRKHTKGYLKSVELRPYSNTKAAAMAERALANRLRKQGFGVWAGHHDQKH